MYYIDDTNYVEYVQPHHRFIAINMSNLNTRYGANRTIQMLDNNKDICLPGVGIILDDITETSTLYIDDCVIYEIEPLLVSKNGKTLMCNRFEVVRKFESKKEFFKYILTNDSRMMERMYEDILRCFSTDDTYDLFEYMTDHGKNPISLHEIVAGFEEDSIGALEEYKLIELIDMGYVIPVKEMAHLNLTLTSILGKRLYQLFCVVVDYMENNGYEKMLECFYKENKSMILLNCKYSVTLWQTMQKLSGMNHYSLFDTTNGGTER